MLASRNLEDDSVGYMVECLEGDDSVGYMVEMIPLPKRQCPTIFYDGNYLRKDVG